MEKKIKILLVDDHPVVLDGLKAILNCIPDFEVVGTAKNGTEAFDYFKKLQPDITIIDLKMPDVDGVEVISRIRKEFPKAKFIVLTVYVGEEDIYRAFKAGAKAYLLKSASENEIMETIYSVYKGERKIPHHIIEILDKHPQLPELTSRELEVLYYLANGKSNKEISKCLNITIRTVKAHINSILAKLGASNRTEAVSIAIKKGIIKFP